MRNDYSPRTRSGSSAASFTLIAGGFALLALLAVIAISILITGSEESALGDINQRLKMEIADLRSDLARSVSDMLSNLAIEGRAMLGELRSLAESGDPGKEAALSAVDFHRSFHALSEIGEAGGRYTLELISESPRRIRSLSVSESKVLNRFRGDPELKELSSLDQNAGEFRYYRPVYLGSSCVACHGDPSLSEEFWGREDGRDCTGAEMESWKPGDVVGVIVVEQQIK